MGAIIDHGAFGGGFRRFWKYRRQRENNPETGFLEAFGLIIVQVGLVT